MIPWELSEEYYKAYKEGYEDGYKEAKEVFAPTKHGRWIKRGDDSWECSVCHEISCCNGNYCVDCGAKMDEVKNDN